MGSNRWRISGWARASAALAVCVLLAAPATPEMAVPPPLPAEAAPGFERPAAADPAELARALPQLARQVLAAYREDDRRLYLDNRSQLQIVAGQPAAAAETLAALRALGGAGDASPQAAATRHLYEIYAAAQACEEGGGPPSPAALERSFHETVSRLDDRTAALVLRALSVDAAALQQNLKDVLERGQREGAFALADALALARAYHAAQVFGAFTPLAAALTAEDDARRYAIERDVPVRTPEGATVCALVVRPRGAAGRLPALLNFTIYANPQTLLDEARRTASHGYIGIEGLTRGKGCSPDAPVPYEHDGADAAALIDWIARQPWSDGRVGMYGGSYEGFTQWAAAKHRPKALKALMPSVTAAPGIDVPMEGNVFQSFVYYWPFYTTDNKTLDEEPSNDRARWRRMNREWYRSGRPYRDLAKIDGTPNPFFERWLGHPDYDAYWQAMIPFGREFAAIDLPVLTTTGYYDDAQIGALYYFTEHHHRRPGAEHYLLIGPYDHIRGQRGTISRLGQPLRALRGYETDPVATLDLGELRYQWFDYVLRGGPKPALLQDKVNYEVMGADEWGHAPSLAAMGSRRQRFHLAASPGGDGRLSPGKPPRGTFVSHKVDLADRTDLDRLVPGGAIVDRKLDRANAVFFASDPLPAATELSGLFSGRLEFVANKQDFDLSVELYELTAQGEYVELSFFLGRASYIQDRSHRRLLQPGRRQRLDFRSGRLTSRKLAAGSRLLVGLRSLKSPGAQINLGSGKDVSDETVADAGAPLEIRWLGSSFVDIPTRASGTKR
jgi:putative CocE/NonD family hydrolase